MKRRILIDLERLRYPNSGIAFVFRNLAKGLLQSKSGLSYDFYGPEKELNCFLKPKHIVKRLFWHKMVDFFSSTYDLIHVSHQLSPYFKKNYKTCKKLVTLHDLNFLHEDLPVRKKGKMLKKVNRSLRYADAIVCISNFVKNDFEKNRHLLDLQKLKTVEVIYNGLIFPEERQYDLKQFSDLGNRKYFLNIGVLFNKKNQLALVKMLQFVEEDLVLVVSQSNKNYEEEVLSFIQQNNLGSRVHILRNVTNEEKYALLQNCEALLQPSYAEGFGIPPIEAMYFGKPVFLSTFTSLPEVGGDLAYFFHDFEPMSMADVVKDGLIKYKTQPELKKQLTNWALKFDYKIMAKQYNDCYERLLKV